MKKILVVEDNDTVRRNLEDILSVNDYEVFTASNGLEGFNAALDIIPDLIISDIMMPDVDGYALLHKIKENISTSEIPFIFLTAKSGYVDFRSGMNSGADDYLSKPFTVHDLLNSVTTVFNKQNKVKAKLQDLRDNIAFSIPHELRTPLTAIIGYSEILRDEIKSIEQAADLVWIAENIRESGIKLNSVINKFILYSDVTYLLEDSEAALKYRKAKIDFPKSVIISAANKVMSKFNRTADFEYSAIDTTLKCFDMHLSFIVEELLENSCKYSKPQSKIELQTAINNSQFELSVLDSGIGFTQDQIASVTAFKQFDRRIHEIGGSGLGLAIVKKIALLYGGSFGISKINNLQTSVWVKLPIV